MAEEHRVVAAERRGTVHERPAGSARWGPTVPERTGQEIHVCLGQIQALEVLDASEDGRHIAIVIHHRETLAADACRREMAQAGCTRGIAAAELQRAGAAGGELLGLDVDERTAEVALLVGRERLCRRDRLEQAGRKHVERHDAPFRFRTGHTGTVERARGVALTESTDEHVLPVLYRDAADALHGLRRVAVRALRDLFSGDRADNADRTLLLVRRLGDGAALGLRRDDTRRQRDRGAGHADVLLDSLAGIEEDSGDLLLRIANALDEQGDRACRRVGDR